MKVVIFDEELHEPSVLADILWTERVAVDDPFGHVFCKLDTPYIVTEDGDILRGYECWWMPVSDFVTINHIMLYKQVVVS